MIKFLLNKIPRKYLQKIADVIIPFSVPFLWGRQIKCPICSGSFRKILSYGYVTSRKNALCPQCLSLERHRMMWYYLKTETDFFSVPQKILHVAPEFPFLKRFEKITTKLGGEYITADIESPLAKVKMNVEDIPFEDNYFDVVFCNHVLEHVDDDLKAMKELYRVLKPNGWGIILSPVDNAREQTYEDSLIINPQQRKIHFGQHDHQRLYGLDYSKRLAISGFDIIEVDYHNTLDTQEYNKMAFSDETLYVVRKEGGLQK